MDAESTTRKMSLLYAWTPYVLIGLLLVITRVKFLPVGDWVKALSFGYSDILGTTVSNTIEPLYLPGILPFILVALLCIPMYRMSGRQVGVAWKDAIKRIKNPTIALLFAVPLVRVMMQSGNSPQGWESMPLVMAEFMTNLVKGAWPLFDPFIGALGAFMAGSNTVSNMLFSLFQYSVADQLGISHTIIVALQSIGGAIGNMICVHNVVAACATVGLAGVEGILIRRNLLPMTLYGIVVGIIGLILVYFVVPGLF
jgi:lactate permease